MNMKDLSVLPLPLTPVEREQLSDYEATITRGLNTFYEVAAAFVHIKQRKLYRADYHTFEDYCREKWHVDRSYADRMIEAAEVRENLASIGTVLPEKESHARALSGLTPDQQRHVWPKVIETAPHGKVTAKHIDQVIQMEIPREPEPVPAAAPVHTISTFVPQEQPRPKYGPCARCKKQLTGPGHFKPDGAICDVCDRREWDQQRAANDPAEREPEEPTELHKTCARCGCEFTTDIDLTMCSDCLTKFYPDDDAPAGREPEAVHMCNFCGDTLPAAQVYSHIYNDRTEQHHICRACASKVLYELLDPDDPDVIADASLQEAHFHSSDRDKIMQAGLRLFRAVDEEFKPGERVRELKEYTPTGAKDGNPLMGSWKRVATFPTTAALKRRIAELEHEKTCIFESRI